MEQVLAEIIIDLPKHQAVLLGLENNEDAVIVSFPTNKALIQSIDVLTPVVNNPYWWGQIVAANALSDIYAKGGTPFTAMNFIGFPTGELPLEVLRDILRGGFEKITESGAILAGGHSITDSLKYGLAVNGTIDSKNFATNSGFAVGDELLLTKPLGTGILSTALKANWDNAEQIEKDIFFWASKLNNIGAQAITKFGLKAATDVTGFGLGGHLLEIAKASKISAKICISKLPSLPQALELAKIGLVPVGSYKNQIYYESEFHISEQIDAASKSLLFDPQTSGGLILGVPKSKFKPVCDFLNVNKEFFAHIGVIEKFQSPYHVIVQK